MRPVNVIAGLCAVFMIAAGSSSAFAQGNDRVAIGGQASTAGFGPEIAYSVSPHLTVRGVGNYLSFDYDETYDGIDYDLDVDLMSAGGFVDYHPLRNGFHVTVGALFNGNEAGLGATAGPGATVGGFTVPAGQSAGLRGDLSVDEFSPYIGLGYDTTFTSRSNWTFTVRAGVLYQGNPEVALRQTSGATTIPQSDLDAEARNIEDELDLVEFFPVLSIGLNYRF